MDRKEEKNVLKIPAYLKPTERIEEEKKQRLRVAAYCRVSTEQESQSSSYANQISYYQNKINKKDDWVSAGIYADEGISGISKKKRESFLQMIQDCEDGKIDLILTKSISRFARNTVDLLTTIRNLKNRNIAVYFEKEHINTLDGAGEILITILSSQAQEESRNISENICWSLRRKFENGEVIINHNHFMGYTKDASGQLQIVPKEAEIVREIFRLYLIGHSSIFIARYLEQHEMKTVMGKSKWRSAVIDKMLSNEKYMGAALLQKTYTVDFLTRQRVNNNGELSKYFIQNNHSPIVSKEIFYNVQNEKLIRSYFRLQESGRPSQYPITAKLICGYCGNHFLRVTRTKDEKEVIVWRCKNRILHGDKYCKKLYTIREKNLHKVIWKAYSHVLHTACSSDCTELHKIADQMEEQKKIILQVIKENIQGLWAWNELTSYHAKLRREYIELCDSLFQKFTESEEFIFIRQPFTHIQSYSNYKKYEDELVNLYVERIWTVASNEIIILFKNGSMIREKWNY